MYVRPVYIVDGDFILLRVTVIIIITWSFYYMNMKILLCSKVIFLGIMHIFVRFHSYILNVTIITNSP